MTGQELAVRDRDEVVGADEDVELRGVEPLDRAVVDGEVEDGEEVALLGVVVDLRPLALRDDVLDVERMPAEALGELPARVSTSGASTWTQVSPLAVSSADDGRRRVGRQIAYGHASAGCEAGSASVLRGSSFVSAMFSICSPGACLV